MKRLIEEKLLQWKNKKDKMPLLLFGARQVGKTTTVFNFGKTNYSNIVMLNFENNIPLWEVFKIDLNPNRIILALEKIFGQTISKETTLLFFDEVQACPQALTSLKYFCEQEPNYHIIAAGSLLGVNLNREKRGRKEVVKVSFPVGKVNVMTMYPMNFEEFLMAVNPFMINDIKECFSNNTPMLLHESALDLYRTYLFVGGMPKAVQQYIDTKDFDYVRFCHNEILSMYATDMAKYTTLTEQIKINEIYNTIPAQLAKENRKFQYKLIGSNARAINYEIGLDWLVSSGIVLKCMKINEGKYPIAFFVNFLSYKIYMSDVGMLNTKGNALKSFILSSDYSVQVKGAMTENYVAQEFVANNHTLYYWESNNIAEVDFVLQLKDGVVPVEVKSATNTQSKSLKVFIEKYNPKYSIRISAKNFGFENNIKSVPLYAVFCIK